MVAVREQDAILDASDTTRHITERDQSRVGVTFTGFSLSSSLPSSF